MVLGVTVTELIVAALTVNGVDPVTPPIMAEIVTGPPATALTSPGRSVVFTVATALELVPHATLCVISCVLESLKIPNALNANWVNGAMVCMTGVTTIVAMVGFVTVNVTAGAVTVPSAAEIMLVPGATAVPTPLAAMVATPVSVDDHVT
jgi:hypothetical protein